MKNFSQTVDLVKVITKAQLKSRYRNTFAGFVWVLLNPILTFLVQAMIFRHVLNINVENYFLFLLAGIIPWVFITSNLNMTVSSFVLNRSTLLAFNIRPYVFLVSQVIDNFINFVVAYTVLFFFFGPVSFVTPVNVALFSVAVMILLLFGFFLSFMLAVLHVFFRDVQFIVQFVLSLAYFVTPIFYPIKMLPEKLQQLVKFNPFYIFIRPFQFLIWEYNLEKYFNAIAIALITLAITITISTLTWKKLKGGFYFRI